MAPPAEMIQMVRLHLHQDRGRHEQAAGQSAGNSSFSSAELQLDRDSRAQTKLPAAAQGIDAYTSAMTCRPER